METEHFVSLSTVSLRLIKQPEHRPEFEKHLTRELRETLKVPETVTITTMPDSPSWWTRAKTIAAKMEAERKYAEEHPECAKSPHGKHEWRFGVCVWCGKEATETGPISKEYYETTKESTQEETKIEKEKREAINFLDDIIKYGVEQEDAYIAEKHYGDFLYTLGQLDALGVDVREIGLISVDLGPAIIDRKWSSIRGIVKMLKERLQAL